MSRLCLTAYNLPHCSRVRVRLRDLRPRLAAVIALSSILMLLASLPGVLLYRWGHRPAVHCLLVGDQLCDRRSSLGLSSLA